MNEGKKDQLYILLISIHGLIRGKNLELGRDEDTGGQTFYVSELARALGSHSNVGRVDLLTRMVIDPKVSEDYARPEEEVDGNVRIIRIPCGPRRYLRKEVLWPHLDSFADGAIKYLHQIKRVPDIVHGHYADAGYAAASIAAMLAAPMAFTGHSLGRLKLQRLLDKGMKAETIEERYRISQRIEAEEVALDSATLVIASTKQEIQEQYALYDKYQPGRMVVIPPGIDVDRFKRPPPQISKMKPPILKNIARFLREPSKPLILAVARPDPRKNIAGLLHVYGNSQRLQKAANLVIMAGNRQDIQEMEKGPKGMFTDLFQLVDKYDLYGKVAYPKQHDLEDIPDLYNLAARTKGVHANLSLSEGFGLTLIEAAASGLPVVTTNVGGPVEIIKKCKNGVLVDPLDYDKIEESIYEILTDQSKWEGFAEEGMKAAQQHYSWSSHTTRYISALKAVIGQHRQEKIRNITSKSSLVTLDRALICDMDNTLLGDKASLEQLLKLLNKAGENVGFGVATGRNSALALEGLKEWQIPTPHFVISSVGTGIRYGPNLVEDRSWIRHISYRWRPDDIREILALVAGLELQPLEGQREFKISYNIEDPEQAPTQKEVATMLRQAGISAKVIYSHHQYVDVLPIRASKGLAIRFLAMKWDIPIERILVAGDSGNDEEMLVGNNPAVVVGNHDPELEHLQGMPRVYFAEGHYAQGIIEAMEYFDFLGDIHIPEQTEATTTEA